MRQLKISKQITSRDAQSLDKYLNEIGKVDLITADEEVLLAKRIKEGDDLALEKLVKANLRFVVSVAKQYQHTSMTLGDLINEGNVGLIKAALKFDETRGFKFISYAVWWIRQSIIQSLAEQSRIVRLPLNRVTAIQKIAKTFSNLEQEFQRAPTSEELGEVLEMTEEEVQRNMSVSSTHLSLDNPLGTEDSTLSDVLENKEVDKPDSELVLESLREEIIRALSSLSDREKEVMVASFGLSGHSKKSLEEIGDELKLTRERVRQIKESAIKKLRKGPRKDLLKQYLG